MHYVQGTTKQSAMADHEPQLRLTNQLHWPYLYQKRPLNYRLSFVYQHNLYETFLLRSSDYLVFLKFTPVPIHYQMSGSAKGGGATTQAVVQDPPESSDKTKDQQKAAAPLEEDDEFEDFPVEGTVR